MKTDKYQGWTNYETWAVNLWLTNDSGIYDMIREMGQEAKAEAPELEAVKDEIWTVENGAKFTLADRIKDYIEENNPLENQNDLYKDLLQGALSEVNWNEIAASFLEIEKEN